MWQGFEAEYTKRKGASTKSSVLDKVRGLLKVYPKTGEPRAKTAALQEIERELRTVKKATRWFSDNPAIKYALAIGALEVELLDEKKVIAATREATYQGIVAKVKREGTGALVDPPIVQSDPHLAAQKRKNAERWKSVLERTPTTAEYRAPIEAAFATMCREPKFARYYLDEVGWTSAHSWLTWGLRLATPAMVAGPGARDAQEFLSSLALAAGVKGKQYAEAYLLELSIYCSHEADRADVSFCLGQATSLFGVLLGPVISGLGWGVAGVAARAGKMGGEIGLGVLATKNLADSDGDQVDVEVSDDGHVEKPLLTAMNAMRFTHSWLRYVTEERGLSDAAKVVAAEFGGVRGCGVIYDQLMHM
jgi:hypothetical protein